MNGMWAVARCTMRDGIRRKAWFPFAVAIPLAVFVVVIQFGFTLRITSATPWADNIISGFFWLWVWGAIITTVSLGATSMPIERRSQALFTLPIARWELIAGKIIGTQILVFVILTVGYALSVAIAIRQHLAITPYAYFGFATALTASFVVLCLSVPLGMRMSSIVAGTLTAAVLMLNFILEIASRLSHASWINTFRSVLPWRIPGEPMQAAFFDSIKVPSQHIDYPLLGLNALLGVVFLVAITFLTRKSELSKG